ncbi:MarR family winged helix-turn-helix transcriptional regulator [Curtobacterium luteum]|uniref:MarR family winged helix-turn-helix transcriptional regulator n=1 Tax=Curtobacterium luteum TaxID=33881 RepID=UPI000736BBE2|nr:MarR family transcriptional regulator [Curtobacterium luteum]
MADDGERRGREQQVTTRPSTTAGAEALDGLQALSDSAHESDELALQTLQLRSTEALALQHVVRADVEGRSLSPTMLSGALRLTTAGVTKLVDRLARAGLVERVPNPTDRRALAVVPTDTARAELARAYRHVQDPVIAVIDELTDAEAEVVGRFANRLAAALRTARALRTVD